MTTPPQPPGSAERTDRDVTQETAKEPEPRLRPELGDEAGDYIEDEPATWLAVVKAMRRYGEHFAPLTANVGDPDGAAEILAGSMLGYLASVHSVFVRFEPPPLTPDQEQDDLDAMAPGNFV